MAKAGAVSLHLNTVLPFFTRSKKIVSILF
jgi:hypothetical protein